MWWILLLLSDAWEMLLMLCNMCSFFFHLVKIVVILNLHTFDI